jgi:uncharacterized protein (DUF362 family)
MRTVVKNEVGIGEFQKDAISLAKIDRTAVSLLVTDNRYEGVLQAVNSLGQFSFSGQHVLLKPNFNSSDPSPGSTHMDVLKSLVTLIRDRGAEKITVAERSGMGSTRQVMDDLKVFEFAEEFGLEVLVLDELPADAWEYVQPTASHWKKGFAVPRMLREVGSIVQTCCLKTHRFGGHFTLSLKNSVGLVAKKVPGDKRDYMFELHTSRNQRRMIAEINTSYSPDLIVLDGMTTFTSGGPANGKLASPNIILAGTDRIAIDAIGVAILRMFGTTKKVSKGKIFKQAQIARAVELGLGIHSPEQIEILTSDRKSEEFVSKLTEILYN